MEWVTGTLYAKTSAGYHHHSRAGDHIQCPARRDFRRPQCRQLGAALRARRHYHATSAALEFAVQSLKVKNIVVLGHGRCGGIEAALNPAADPLSPGDFIGKWMELLAPPAQSIVANQWMTRAERQTALEHISIRFSIANLRTFPCVSILEGRQRLALHGAWFDIAEGKLWIMDPDTGDFARHVVEAE